MRNVPGGAEADIIKFMDMLPEEKLREVPDPYYTGNFEEVYLSVPTIAASSGDRDRPGEKE